MASDVEITDLYTRKTLTRMRHDPRLERKAQILQELRDPERLTDEQIQALFVELAELMYSLDKDPAEEE